MTDNEQNFFVGKNGKGEECIFLKDGDKIENVSKSFRDIMAMLNEAKQNDTLGEELKKEVRDFINKELNKHERI